jgi:Fe-coproporphyrin III synthase
MDNISGLKDAVIAVTYQCNSRCRMCNIWQIKNNKPGLMPEDFLNLPETLRSVNITGGEPFLRPDLDLIIATVKKRCPKANIIISSNGFATDLITSQMQKIIGIDPEIGVAISIDGIGKAHEEIRGIEGGYEKVLSTIMNLKKLGVKHLKIGFTLGDYNATELLKVYRLAARLGMEFSLAIVHSSENYFGKVNILKDKEKMIGQLDWLIKRELGSWNKKQWGRAYFAHGAREFIRTGKRILPDYSGKFNIFIDPRGDVYPCDVSSDKIGEFSDLKNIKSGVDENCHKSWMVCTARQSIKKHWMKVSLWIVVNKLKNIFLTFYCGRNKK